MNAFAARQVRVEVDEAGQQRCWAEIDQSRTGGNGQGSSHRLNPLAADAHHGRLEWRTAAAVDQSAKFWLLFVFDLGARGIVTLMPFLDLVLTWNTGISYGLFPQEGALGQWLLFAVKVAAVVFLFGVLSGRSA